MLKWSPLLGKLHIWSFQLSQALKPPTAYRQKNSREANHKQQTGDVGFGVFSHKVTLLACGSGPAQIVFLYSTIKLNIYFVSYTLSTRFSLFIYRITSTLTILYIIIKLYWTFIYSARSRHLWFLDRLLCSIFDNVSISPCVLMVFLVVFEVT